MMKQIHVSVENDCVLSADIATLRELSHCNWSEEECCGALQKNDHDTRKAYSMLHDLHAILLDDDVDADAKNDVRAGLAELEQMGVDSQSSIVYAESEAIRCRHPPNESGTWYRAKLIKIVNTGVRIRFDADHGKVLYEHSQLQDNIKPLRSSSSSSSISSISSSRSSNNSSGSSDSSLSSDLIKKRRILGDGARDDSTRNSNDIQDEHTETERAASKKRKVNWIDFVIACFLVADVDTL